VDADLDTLATALYVRVDDLLKTFPERAPWRPRVGIAPKITDAEVVTLAVMAALLGFSSERRWLRFAREQLRTLFPYLPEQPGYNKRLRRLVDTIGWLIGALARDTTPWTDDVWLADSTPVECGRSRETAKRSELAGFAEYGYCASHSRYFWGLRLHLLCTLDAPCTGCRSGSRSPAPRPTNATPCCRSSPAIRLFKFERAVPRGWLCFGVIAGCRSTVLGVAGCGGFGSRRRVGRLPS
jgi:hypothetical protein